MTAEALPYGITANRQRQYLLRSGFDSGQTFFRHPFQVRSASICCTRKDQSRIQQKIYCPVDDAIIDRSELVRGYEVEKGRYVTFTDEELKQLEARNEHVDRDYRVPAA